MKDIVFVTTNEGKIAYANSLIKDINVIAYEYDLTEPRGDDIKQIAIEKAKQAYKLIGRPCIAMDIGFFIKALNGFPRAYVNHALDTIGIDGVLKLMDEVDNRYCEFRECLVYYDGTEMEVFESVEPALIFSSKRGKEQKECLSELWYIVKPIGFEKTLAEFDEHDFLEHRKNQMDSSLNQFGKWFNSKIFNNAKQKKEF